MSLQPSFYHTPTSPQLMVQPDSYLTLHYQLATKNGVVVLTTLNSTPATLQMGAGNLAPFLEAVLLGLTEETHCTFLFQPEKAYGLRHDDFIQRIQRSTLEKYRLFDKEKALYQIGDIVAFTHAKGGGFNGVVRSLEEDTILFDFNHPLAGEVLLFEVHVISIL